MVTSKYFSGDGQTTHDVSAEQIGSRIKANDGGTLWVDIAQPGEDDFQMLETQFGFHPLAIEDLQERDQRPKVDEYDDYVFVVVHEWHPAPGREDLSKPCVERSAEINAFVSRNYIVTLHTGESQALQAMRKRWEANKEIQKQGPFALLYLLLDSVVDDYFPALDAYDDRIDTLEQIVLKPAG